MSTNAWVRVAGVAGATAVALGAIGAHAIVKRSDTMKDVWRTAAHYHLIHSLALGVSALNFAGRKRVIVCSLFLGGILLFCGSCYTVVLMDQRSPFNKPAPVGGMLFIFGWLAFGLL